MNLPDRSLVHATSPGDPVRYYYHWLYRLVYRKRLRMALDLLGTQRRERLLEIGYGSGILLPELARRAKRLDGIDMHEEVALVTTMLEAMEVKANLRSGDILSLPYPDGMFQAVVCLSVLEHLTELDRACAEIDRVLAADGIAVVGFPVANAVTTALFRWLGYRAKEIHPSAHGSILIALDRRFRIRHVRRLPDVLPIGLGLYVACQCVKR
jgi:ubiquinone/menaquinone biosynthesis C-methylase UbiE